MFFTIKINDDDLLIKKRTVLVSVPLCSKTYLYSIAYC